MNALELALMGRTPAPVPSPLPPSEAGYKMARALLAWADKHNIDHAAIRALRKVIAAHGDPLDEIHDVWFELPESIDVRPWRPIP